MALFIPFKKFLKESEIKEEAKDSKTIFSEVIKFLKDAGYIETDDTIGEWVLSETASEAKTVEDLVDLTTLLELLNRNIPPEVFEEVCTTCSLEGEGEAFSESVAPEGESLEEPFDEEIESEVEKELEDVEEELSDIDEEQKTVEEKEEALEEKEEELEEEEEALEEEEESLEMKEDILEDTEDVYQEEELEEEEQLNEAKYRRLKKFVKEANERRSLDREALKNKINQRREELKEARKRKLGRVRLIESLKKKRHND